LNRRVRVLLGFGFLLLVGYPFIKSALLGTWDYTGCDFEIFYTAAQDLANGQSPYPGHLSQDKPGSSSSGAWGGYIYPALFARILIPLTGIERLTARHLYLLVCLILYTLLLFPWRKVKQGRWTHVAWVLVILLGWGPVIQNFRFAQSNFVPLFLFTLSWKLLSSVATEKERGRRLWMEASAGILFGIGSTVKLTPLLLLPVLAVTRRWRLSAGILAGMCVGFLLSGPRSDHEFFFRVLPALSHLPKISQSMSLPTLIDREAASIFSARGEYGLGQRWDEFRGSGFGHLIRPASSLSLQTPKLCFGFQSDSYRVLSSASICGSLVSSLSDGGTSSLLCASRVIRRSRYGKAEGTSS